MVKGELGRSETPLRRWFSPAVAFPAAYLAYFAVGSINVVPYRGLVGLGDFLVMIAGLASYALSLLVVGRVLRMHLLAGHATTAVAPPKARPLGVMFLVLGTLAAVTIIAANGIPLLAGESRLRLPGYGIGIAWTSVLGLILLGYDRIASGKSLADRRILAVGIFVMGLVLLLGYRSPLLYVGLTLAVAAYHSSKYRVGLRELLWSAVGVTALAWLAVVRFGAGLVGYFMLLASYGMQPVFYPVAPLWLTAREGVGVFHQLTEAIPNRVPFQHGWVLVSSFATLLPGTQPAARGVIAHLVGGRDGITLTPSILGQPYADWGIPGVVVSMATFAAVLGALDWWARRSRTWAPQLAFSFTTVALLVAIHSGLLDPVVFLTILGTIAYAAWAEREAGSPRFG